MYSAGAFLVFTECQKPLGARALAGGFFVQTVIYISKKDQLLRIEVMSGLVVLQARDEQLNSLRYAKEKRQGGG